MIVLDRGVLLPEGTRVLVSIAPQIIKSQTSSHRVELPLVRSANPGSVCLTNEMIGEIFDAEDIASCQLRPDSDITTSTSPNPQ